MRKRIIKRTNHIVLYKKSIESLESSASHCQFTEQLNPIKLRKYYESPYHHQVPYTGFITQLKHLLDSLCHATDNDNVKPRLQTTLASRGLRSAGLRIWNSLPNHNLQKTEKSRELWSSPRIIVGPMCHISLLRPHQ